MSEVKVLFISNSATSVSSLLSFSSISWRKTSPPSSSERAKRSLTSSILLRIRPSGSRVFSIRDFSLRSSCAFEGVSHTSFLKSSF